MTKPLVSDRPVALDLCVGLGGWTEGLVAEGWFVIGIDIEDMFAALHEPKPDHFELRIADICNVRGADYAHVNLIVGSSPCQDFSYRAMPWKRAKALHAPFLGMFLFWQQFRIQREVNEARARMGLPPVPMMVENVRGAQTWVGKARWNSGSMYFWGDVPALMPKHSHVKAKSFRFDGNGGSFQTAAVSRWFNDGPRSPDSLASSSSSSPARKAASAKIAKIPFEISSYIARVYRP